MKKPVLVIMAAGMGSRQGGMKQIDPVDEYGHINDTYRVTFENEQGVKKHYILQQMNKSIFKNPVELMENIVGVTEFLKRKISANGGNPERETLNVIPAKDGKPYYVDSEGEYWRAYVFIENTVSYDLIDNPEILYEGGLAFGRFQSMLADYPAKTLHETIPGFHDTRERFETFKKAVEEDVCSRVDLVRARTQFKLVSDMEHKWKVMENIVKKYM